MRISNAIAPPQSATQALFTVSTRQSSFSSLQNKWIINLLTLTGFIVPRIIINFYSS